MESRMVQRSLKVVSDAILLKHNQANAIGPLQGWRCVVALNCSREKPVLFLVGV